MNLKKLIATGIVLSFGLFVLNCKSAQTKEEPKKTAESTVNREPQTQASNPGQDIESINQELSKVKLTGFKKNQTKLANTATWLESSLPVVKSALSKLPDGYVLEIKGHCDKSGSATVNRDVSNKRAAYIYSLFINQGLDKSKLAYKGYGARDTLEGLDPFDSQNRRVSFEILKK